MAEAAAVPAREVRHYRSQSVLRRIGRRLMLAFASMIFLSYVLAPIACHAVVA